MKRFVFALCLLLILTSCGDTEPPERLKTDFVYTESDDYPLYFGSSQIHDLKYNSGYIYKYYSGNLYRLNPRTGNVTYVCGDPLCLHNSADCPLYGMLGIYHLTDSGELCYNIKYATVTKNQLTGETEREKYNQFVHYDAENQKKIVIDDIGEQSSYYGPEIYSGKWRIYMGQEYDAENDRLIYGMRRADITTGKNSFWGGEEQSDGSFKPLENAAPLFALDGRFYFNDGKYIFSLDENGKNRENALELNLPLGLGCILTDGTWLYYTSSDRQSILRTNLRSQKTETLVDDPEYTGSSFILTKDYIYYQSGTEIVLGKADIPGYAAKEIVLSGENFMRCRHDGSEKTPVFTFEGENAGIRPLYWTAVGNYIYCSYKLWDDSDSDGVFHGEDQHLSDQNGCELLRIDLSTKETKKITIVR